MKKEEVLKKAKEHYWFLSEFPEWNNDKEVVLAAVKQNGLALEYASKELKNDKEVVLAAAKCNGMILKFAPKKLRSNKEIVLAAVQQNGLALQYASEQLRNDKEIVLNAISNRSYAGQYSLLEGYDVFNKTVEKEGEEFLFSCWKNEVASIRIQVANHPNFIPTIEQIKIGLEDYSREVREIYQLRQDEWLAKIEESKLRNAI